MTSVEGRGQEQGANLRLDKAGLGKRGRERFPASRVKIPGDPKVQKG